MPKKILAFDLGTGGVKSSMYNSEGTCLASIFEPYCTEYPQSGWHEQRPHDWWCAIVNTARALIKDTGVSPNDIAVISTSGHGLGCVPIGASGNLLRDMTPIWSDSRASAQAERFFETIDHEDWYHKTGNGFPAPHYPVFKLQWYRDNEPEMFGKIDKFLGTKDYVNHLLCGNIVTDNSYASGSGVYSLEEGKYDENLITASGLPREIFPKIVPSSEIIGNLTDRAAELLGLPKSVLVAAGGVDNSCMALGAGNVKPHRIYASLGASSWVAVSDTKPLLDLKLKPYVFAHVIPGMFTSAIGMFSSGTSLRWVRDHFCRDIIEFANARGLNVYDLMCEQAQLSCIGAHRLMMNPSFAGGSSFDPSRNIRGAFLGLDLSHTQGDIIRATLEGIALNMRVLLDAIRKMTEISESMVVVGGGSTNEFWRQIYADAMRIQIEKTNIGQNAAGLGAATVGAVGAGIWKSFDIIDEIRESQSLQSPIERNAEKYDKLLPLFKKASDYLAELGDFWHENAEQRHEVMF